MRLLNKSRLDADLVRALVEFACQGVNMARVQVNVKNGCDRIVKGVEMRNEWGALWREDVIHSRFTFAGMAYCGVPLISPASRKSTVDYLVTVRIGPDTSFPMIGHTDHRLKSLPPVDIRNVREALVYVAAHEARHIYQFKNGKRVSEKDCERFAHRALARYRAARAKESEGGRS